MYIHTSDEEYEKKLLNTFNERRMFIVPGKTNGRYGIDSLASIATLSNTTALYEGAVFVFCNMGANEIKFLLYEDGSYWLIVRRIYSSTFSWPESKRDKEALESSKELIKRILHSPKISRKRIEEFVREEEEKRKREKTLVKYL